MSIGRGLKRREGAKHENDYVGFVSMVMLSGYTPKVYWRPNTSYSEAKEDATRCHEKAWDAFKAGEISWEKEGKSYRHRCMEEKGYILRNREEAYPSLYSAPLGKQQ